MLEDLTQHAENYLKYLSPRFKIYMYLKSLILNFTLKQGDLTFLQSPLHSASLHFASQIVPHD